MIFSFITYLLGKESPYYTDTMIKQGDNWDLGRPNVQGFEPIVDLVYNLFKNSNHNKLEENTSVYNIYNPSLIHYQSEI